MILSSDHFRWIDALLKEAIIPWLIISPLTQNIFFQNFFFINSHKGWIKERNIYEFRTIFSTSNSQQKLAHMLPFLSCNVHKCLWCLKTNLNLKKKKLNCIWKWFFQRNHIPISGKWTSKCIHSSYNIIYIKFLHNHMTKRLDENFTSISFIPSRH